MNNNKQVAIISVVSNGFLTSLKLIFGIITGSVSLLSEALHSFGDLLASLIAWGSIMESSKPADKEHQFGHGKFEDMAGFIEA
ncbi:TPA: cation transporter, partial [Candidatus Galligastranaerophilus gallistercoris]|nr:cation transporter [Candidatus Galligastranaerophilus gallistercoris]